MDEYKLIFEHFKSMERRYHTWMNYYSLFNGVLLVAYCSILVGAGQIVKKNDNYTLDCAYWDFLMLIVAFGMLVSVCWLYSMIGCDARLNNWHLALRQKGYDFDNCVYVWDKAGLAEDTNEREIASLPFYSTAKIANIFIGGVIIAWFLVGIYTVIKGYTAPHISQCGFYYMGFCSIVTLLVIGFLFFRRKKLLLVMPGYKLKEVKTFMCKKYKVHSVCIEIVDLIRQIIKSVLLDVEKKN